MEIGIYELASSTLFSIFIMIVSLVILRWSK